jgi:hypothetical protein
MKSFYRNLLASLVLTIGLGGCATSSAIVSQWRNPTYGLGTFKRIMVGALGEDTSIRRNLEDEFLIHLRAAGVDALPSYRYLKEDENIDEAKLKQTAQHAGADALLFARALQVEQKTRYEPSYFPYTSFGTMSMSRKRHYGT